MRWVVAEPGPSFSVQDVYNGWVEALRELGEHVIEFNLGDRLAFYGSAERNGKPMLTPDQVYELAVNSLYSTLYQAWPDVLLVVSGFFIPPRALDLARRSRTRVVLIHTESPYEDERQLGLAPMVDVNLINDPTNLGRFRQVAPHTYYLPHAYRPSVHHPGDPEPELRSDLVFVGTGFRSRVQFFERMDLSGLDVTLAGNWGILSDDHPLRRYVAHDIDECCSNYQAARLYRSARCGINIYRREAEKPELSAGWAMGPREVEMAACNLFFLRDPRPEGDELLPMLPTFSSPEEAGELLRWWLAHPDEMASAAAKARAAIADRTFINNAKWLLRLLN